MTVEAKLFEIRDDGTTIVAIALKPKPGDNEAERWAWARAGYGTTVGAQEQYVLLAPLMGGEGKLTCDPYKHGRSRTYQVAHAYIRDMWDILSSGDVVDVQYLLKETEAPKEPERVQVLKEKYRYPRSER